jgi:uncharacterized protein YeaO (DUF488 family)
MPKAEFTSQNWYDMWFPNLGPNVETMKLGQDAMTPVQWAKFIKKYRAEMAIPENSHVIELLAALSCHPTSRWAATSRMKYIAIVQCYSNYWSGSCTNTGAPESEPAFGFVLRGRSVHSQAQL